MSPYKLDETARGVYIISATPFLEDGSLDLESTDRLADFYIEQGVSGITVLGMMGEAQKMAPEESEAFLTQAPVFERMLVDDGILLFKYWLTVDQDMQEQRFAERQGDPLKRWKLSPVDLEARSRYEDYGRARDRMLKATHTRHAPWTLVDFNDQRLGRLSAGRVIETLAGAERAQSSIPARRSLMRAMNWSA